MKSKMYSRLIITSGRGALGSCHPAAKLRSPIYFKIQISLHTSLAFNSIVISELVELGLTTAPPLLGKLNSFTIFSLANIKSLLAIY